MATDVDGALVGIEPRASLVRKAKDAASEIAKRAAASDRDRRLPHENVRALHEAGLLTVAIPKDLGGEEADLVTQIAVYEIIGGACASTAWVMGNHSVMCNRSQGMMGDAARPLLEDVVRNGALIAHAAIPGGETAAAPGGFVTSGRWPFVSGSNLSKWIFLSTMVDSGVDSGVDSARPGTNGPQNRWMMFPSDQPGLTIEQTWLAMSARASMSNDVLMANVFVSEAAAPLDNRPPPHLPWLPHGAPVLRVPSRARVWMAALTLGIAQAALDETIEFAKTRTMTLGGSQRGSMPGNQFAIADAAMLIEAGRAFLYQEARAITAKGVSGQDFQPSDANRMEMAGLTARQNAQQAVDRLFAVHGAHGLFESGNFERHYRDVRMGTLHAVSAPDLVREQVGKTLLGIPLAAEPRWG